MELQWNTQSLDITKKQSHGLLGQLKPILHIVTRGTTRHGAKILQAMQSLQPKPFKMELNTPQHAATHTLPKR
jgi:hypothetical protein